MKLLFVNPWTKSLFGDERQGAKHPHIGLAYLIATCKDKGYSDIKVFDQSIEKNDELLFELIPNYKPDLIGITTVSYCYKYAKGLIYAIKERYPKILLICGGPHVSATKEHILKNTKADFAMKGESEISFINFLKEMGKNRPDYSRIKNLIWRDGATIIENQAEEFIKDLDLIPFPDYGAFDLSRYRCYREHMAQIITSRGCPYGCNYCSIKLTMGRNFRPRSPENVVMEIEYLYQTYGINHLEVNDDCFSFDVKRAENICNQIIKSGLNIKYELYNGIRADNVNENLLIKMKESGCVFIGYGCESGNQEVLDAIGKNLELQKVIDAVNLTNKIGIKNSVNFIVGHPTETYEKAMGTIKFAGSLKTNFVNVYNLIPYPGTELFDWITKNATYMMPVGDYLEAVSTRDFTPVFETREFTKDERVSVLKKGYALYEKTMLQFRLGKIAGFIVYLLCRNKFIFKIGRVFVTYGNVGSFIYRMLTRKSRIAG